MSSSAHPKNTQKKTFDANLLICFLFLAAQTHSLKLYSVWRVLRPSAHHRDVQRPQAGIVGDLAGHVAPLAQRQRGADALGARGVLHILQPLGPGRGAHQPQEDQDGRERKVLAGRGKKMAEVRFWVYTAEKEKRTGETHKHGPEVGVLVNVHVAQVHEQRHHAVEEADDGHAHEELGRGRRVSHQVRGGDRAVADGGVVRDKGHLAQPGRPDERGK